MLSIEKRQPRQGGDFNSSSRNLVTFDVPAGSLYDLSRSYLALTTTITATKIPAEADNCIHNVSLKYRPQCLIKNARWQSDRCGDIENVQAVNVLNSNMDKLSKNHFERRSQAVLDGTDYEDEYKNHTSNFTSLHHGKESSSRSPQLNVPLSDVFQGVGRSQYPSFAMGNTQIDVELEEDSKCLQEIRRFIEGVSFVNCNDIGAGDPRNHLVVDGIDSLTQLGLWVGQSILITADGGVVHHRRIITLELAGTTATITIDQDLPAGAFTTVHVTEIAAASLAYTLEAQLVLVSVNLPPSRNTKMLKDVRGGVDIAYRTWEVEQDNMDPVAFYHRNFYLNPNVANVVMLSTGAELDSSIANFNSYRTSINGSDNTNTDVVKSSSLYRDRLMSGVVRMGMPFRSLHFPPDCIIQPVPQSDRQQQFQVRMKATGGDLPANNVYLFKQVNKVLSISPKAVTVK